MNISTNSDYYKQSYLLSSLGNTSASTYSNSTASTTSTTTADSISAVSAKKDSTTDTWDILLNSLSANRIRKALEEKAKVSSEKSTQMENVKADIDAIKDLDIASLSDDEVKEILSNLQSDLQQMPPGGKGQNVLDADLDTMSVDGLRSLLTDVQTDVKSMEKNGPPGGGMPPMGMDFSKLMATDSEAEDSISALIDALTEKYDISTDSDDYLAKLKESLSTMIAEQKAKLDTLGSTLSDKLDEWNSQQSIESTNEI